MTKDGTILLSDYRCFRREAPATLSLAPGFSAFLGPNNAGKSALIRSVYELRNAFTHVHNVLVAVQQNSASHHGFQMLPPMHDQAEIIADREDPQCMVEVSVGAMLDPNQLHVKSVQLLFSANGQYFQIVFIGTDDKRTSIGNGRDDLKESTDQFATTNANVRYSTASMSALLKMLVRIQFVGAFRNAINEGSGSYFDTYLGTSFIAQWHQWKTGAMRAENKAIQRVTDDIRRLMGARTLEVTASNELKTLQVILDGRPHKLQELGSGIAQLIVVLGTALMRKPSYVSIDEPEIHLHPGLQGEFLTALASYTEHGVIFATHSVGLARSVSEHCYTVQPTTHGSLVRPFERTPHYAEFLGSMGIAGLQDIGWDRILLVEGTKDVRTFQQLLRLYEKDRKTVIIPLGGDSMVNGRVTEELAEIVRLGSKIFAVVDSERKAADEEPKKARVEFANICKNLGIECCITERRAIENYLPDRAIKAALGQQYAALDKFDVPGATGLFWGKGDGWKAARAMTKEEADATDIGRFLAAL